MLPLKSIMHRDRTLEIQNIANLYIDIERNGKQNKGVKISSYRLSQTT
jgi:hypothetical protein